MTKYQRRSIYYIFTARKRSLRRLCFYRCLSVHTGGGVRGFIQQGGSCMVLLGGAWFYSGGVCGFSGGCAWFFWGACMVFPGGVRCFSGGVGMVFLGGMHGFFSFFGYNEIRSMSGRYASYWNAFLLQFQDHNLQST